MLFLILQILNTVPNTVRPRSCAVKIGIITGRSVLDNLTSYVFGLVILELSPLKIKNNINLIVRSLI